MGIYVTYGTVKNDLSAVKNDLEKALNIQFKLHESSYWDEYYLFRTNDKQKIRINYNFVDGDWLEDEFKQYPVLIKLMRLKNLDEVMEVIKKELPYAKPIRKTEIIPGIKSKEYLFIGDKPALISEQELKK